ncbi:IS3 family transposase [Staphylococcus auricularis]|uniref:IS3 family transposase n=1 Tax=Staphylococcus auricularis TaxID=29379 RepID=UPI001F5457B0|nr:IS3 family transposase [Staphylococcus auricularis]
MKTIHESLNIELNILFKISNIAKSVYYYWINQLNKPNKDKYILQAIKQICKKCHYTYGYRRVTQVLSSLGFNVNHKKVLKLMQSLALTCKKFTHRGRRYSSFKGKVGKIANNLMNRRFKTDRPYQKIVTDITEFKLKNEQKLYLSTFMDVYNSEIISFTTSNRPTLDIVINPLQELIDRKPKTSYRLTIHSDQGWHYQHAEYIKHLKDNKIFQSMSRKGNCLDNSLMENFFGLLKQEMFYGNEYGDFNQLEKAIHQYIDYYNNERIKAKLKGLSPINYRKQTCEVIY